MMMVHCRPSESPNPIVQSPLLLSSKVEAKRRETKLHHTMVTTTVAKDIAFMLLPVE